jgi:hypothetical protein
MRDVTSATTRLLTLAGATPAFFRLEVLPVKADCEVA